MKKFAPIILCFFLVLTSCSTDGLNEPITQKNLNNTDLNKGLINVNYKGKVFSLEKSNLSSFNEIEELKEFSALENTVTYVNAQSPNEVYLFDNNVDFKKFEINLPSSFITPIDPYNDSGETTDPIAIDPVGGGTGGTGGSNGSTTNSPYITYYKRGQRNSTELNVKYNYSDRGILQAILNSQNQTEYVIFDFHYMPKKTINNYTTTVDLNDDVSSMELNKVVVVVYEHQDFQGNVRIFDARYSFWGINDLGDYQLGSSFRNWNDKISSTKIQFFP
jgi:hypothetical protein